MLTVSKKLPFRALRLLAWVDPVETTEYRGSLAVCAYTLQLKIQTTMSGNGHGSVLCNF